MLLNTNVLAENAWNTWSERPGEIVFLPLGVRVTPVLFSTFARKPTAIRPPTEIRCAGTSDQPAVRHWIPEIHLVSPDGRVWRLLREAIGGLNW